MRKRNRINKFLPKKVRKTKNTSTVNKVGGRSRNYGYSKDCPHKDFDVLIERFGYEKQFPQNCEEEMRLYSHGFADVDRDCVLHAGIALEREDLRQQTVFTIDGDYAKDFDDAVSLKKIGKEFHLGVHIADVSHFVLPGSSLDKEAQYRGTSVYCVNEVLPMLPEKLSNDLCSLKQGEDRLTFSCFMVFDEHGVLQSSRLAKSFICSKRRLTYKDAEASLRKRKTLGDGIDVVLKEMLLLKELLKRRRLKKGSIDFALAQQRWRFTRLGEIANVSLQHRLESEEIVEEFMLAANKVAATAMTNIGSGIYRVHEKPEEGKVVEFNNFLKRHKLALPKCDEEDSFLEKTVNRYFQLMQKITNPILYKIVSQKLLFVMSKAYYDIKNSGHYGLGFANYTHFTSPIRRYPDLVVHRILSLDLAVKHAMSERKEGESEGKNLGEEKIGRKIKFAKQTILQEHALKKITTISSSAERKAIDAEREYEKIKSIRYLQRQPKNLIYEAVAVAFSYKGNCFLQLEKTGIEGVLFVRDFPNIYFDELNKQLWCNKKVLAEIGSRLKVKIVGLNPSKLSIRLGLTSPWDEL